MIPALNRLQPCYCKLGQGQQSKRVLIVWFWKRFTTELDEHWPIITFSGLCRASNSTFGLCGDAQANWCENC